MKNSSSLVLIGGFGFVGRNVLDQIAIRPEFERLKPVVIDNLANAAPGHEHLDLEHFIGGYQAPEATAFIEGIDTQDGARTFVFLAGETRVAESKDRPLDFIAANVSEPAKFVMDNVQHGDNFILISTAGALFDGTFEVSVDSPYCPKNFYGATKAAEEMILEKLVSLRGATFRIVRLTNVFGKFSDKKKSAIHAFTRAAISGDTVTINGDGQQSRDFIFASDVGRGIANLALKLHEDEQSNEVNMLGSGRSTSLLDVVGAIEAASGRPLSKRFDPAENLLATEPRDVIASRHDVKVLLGDDITSFQDAIQQTFEYYA